MIARIAAAAAPGTRGEAVILLPEPADADPTAQPIPLPEGMTLRFGFRSRGDTLLGLLRALPIPPRAADGDTPDDRFVFFAGERGAAQSAKDLLQARGLPREAFRTATYWTAPETPT